MRGLAATVGAVIGLTGAIWTGPIASSGASPSTIKLVLITSLTGPAAANYVGASDGFVTRVELQNARGGINGHKIVPVILDDQTSPTGVVTATQDAISKGAFGIVVASPLFFQAAKYARQAGIPVTGSSADGPEWGEKPYTNMFATDTGSIDPSYPVNTTVGSFLKRAGGSVIGSYGFGISPSSARSAMGTAQAFQRAGGKIGVLDTSVPFGGSDFTTEALVAKGKNVNAIYAAMTDNSNFALATSLAQSGAKLKAVVYPTGYEPAAMTSAAWQDLQGDYFVSQFRPVSLPNAGTRTLVAAMQRYTHRSPSDFPSLNTYEDWVAADFMIEGITATGNNLTQAATIKAMRSVTSYDGAGLLPRPINFKTIFGHDLPQTCEWVLQAKRTGFVPYSATAICGHDVAGTSLAKSS
jgi:branched-chain amino acid transport system substrate-binding protein